LRDVECLGFDQVRFRHGRKERGRLAARKSQGQKSAGRYREKRGDAKGDVTSRQNESKKRTNTTFTTPQFLKTR